MSSDHREPPRSETHLVDMERLLSLQSEDPLALNQVRGPGSPRDFRVLPLQRVVLGRASDCAVVLMDTSASRYHAEISYTERTPSLADRGSTNGTFLNGKQVTRAYLKDGDVIQIAGSTFEVAIRPITGKRSLAEILEEGGTRSHDSIAKIRNSARSQVQRRPGPSSQEVVFKGRLKEVRLPSLLQVLESNKNTGTVVIRKGQVTGRVFLDNGAPVHLTLGSIRGAKAFNRLMAWKDGSFEFLVPGDTPEEQTVRDSLQHLLLEAARELDELPIYRQRLPADDVVLAFNPAKAFRLASISADVFDVMAAVRRHETIGAVMDRCPLTDLDVCRILVMLVSEGIVDHHREPVEDQSGRDDQDWATGPLRTLVEPD